MDGNGDLLMHDAHDSLNNSTFILSPPEMQCSAQNIVELSVYRFVNRQKLLFGGHSTLRGSSLRSVIAIEM